MKLSAKIIGLSLLFLSSWSWAASVPVNIEALTWEDCVREATARHPDLAAERAALRQADADLTVARSPLLPQLGADASARWQGSETLSASRSVGYGLSLQQLIFDGFKTIRALDQAAAGRRGALANYDEASAAVRLRLRTAYVELIQSQAQVTLSREISQRRRQNVDLVQLRYNAGREHRGSLLLAQAQFSQAEADVQKAERSLFEARYSLNRELGRASFAEVVAAGGLTLPGVARGAPDFEMLALKQPQWLAQRAKTESARLGVETSQSAWYPNLNATASAGQSGADWPPAQDSWSAGLSLSWTLFNGGSRLGGIERAQAAYAQAQANEAGLRNTLTLNLVSAWTVYQAALDTVHVREKFLTAAEERSRISAAQYSTGLIGFGKAQPILIVILRATMSSWKRL